MVDEIGTEGAGDSHPGAKMFKPLPQWKPWTPPPGFEKPAEAGPAVDAATKPAAPRIVPDAIQGKRELPTGNALSWGELDFDAMGAADRAKAAAEAGKGLAELGVMATLTQVAVAFSQTTFDPGAIAESLGQFTDNLTRVADKVAGLPGVGDALQVFGGVGGIVTGVLGLKEQIAEARDKGPNLNTGLAAAASAARLVGGVALALTPFAPPLAAVGGSLTLAAAALELGKLAVENRDGIRAAVKKTGQAAGDLTKIIGNNGSAMVGGEQKLAIVANNGAQMSAAPFNWLTG